MSKHRGVTQTTSRLDVAIALLVPEMSRARAAALIKSGVVTVNTICVTKPAAKVLAAAVLTIDVPEPAPAHAVAQDLPVAIVYQDADLVIVNKAAGMVVHPGAGHPDGTLVNALLFHIDDLSGIGGVERPGIVHRLDRGTSGLMVVFCHDHQAACAAVEAKHDQAHRHLSEQFAAHTAGRRYLAICQGVPDPAQGTITSHLARHVKDRIRMASTDGTWGRLAITHYATIAQTGVITLVECHLETGRTHQIRVHCAEQKHPLVGDHQYNRKPKRLPPVIRDVIATNRPLLHAWQLGLEHPTTGERVVFTAQPPADFQCVIDKLEMTDACAAIQGNSPPAS